jgi:hypothetical protein
MYIYPVLLPPFSNREDFLLTLSIFDDDTGAALNLSGTVLANPGAAFTSAAWTVTDGAIVTPSTTPITIPNFPIGSQLAALPLTVGLNLGILAGDPITIADTATGANVMMGYVISYVPATGALVCQIGDIFEFEIRRKGRGHHGGDGYSAFNDIGITSEDGPVLVATLGNGVTIIDIGFVQVLIPAAQFQMLRDRTYLASMTVADGAPNTRQVFVGELPVAYGGVMRSAGPGVTSTQWQNQF